MSLREQRRTEAMVVAVQAQDAQYCSRSIALIAYHVSHASYCSRGVAEEIGSSSAKISIYVNYAGYIQYRKVQTVPAALRTS